MDAARIAERIERCKGCKLCRADRCAHPDAAILRRGPLGSARHVEPWCFFVVDCPLGEESDRCYASR